MTSFQFTERLLPQNIDAEESLLGAILLDSEAASLVAGILPLEAISDGSNRKIYNAVLQCNKRQETDLHNIIDWLVCHNQLDKVGGQAYLKRLMERCVSSVNVDNLAKLLLEKYIRREVISLGQAITHNGYESLLSSQQLLEQVEERVLTLTRSPLRHDDKESSEWQKYTKLIEQIREIELKIPDPGFRAWKLQCLAKKYERSAKQLEEIYFKHLVATSNEPMLDWNELINKHGNDVREWLMHGWIPKNSTILIHAEGGVGKTRLSYEFLYMLITGQSWAGFPVTAPTRKAMIIQTDESPGDMITALKDRGFNESMTVKYKTQWGFEHLQFLQKEIEDYKPDVVLIDSVTSNSVRSDFSENDTEYARPLLMLKDMAEKLNFTAFIVHHDNGEGGSRGTKAIPNSVSQVWGMKKACPGQPDNPDRILVIEKSRARRPAKYLLRFDPDEKSWMCLGEEGVDDASPNTKTKDAIMRFFDRHRNTKYEPMEIQQAVGGTLDHVRRCCSQLANDGQLSCDNSRRPYRYYLPYEGDMPEAPTRMPEGMISLEALRRKDSSSTDHPITETVTQNDVPICQKSEIDDQLISQENATSETPTQQAFQDCEATDHLTDQQLITTDHDQLNDQSPEKQALAECPFQVGDLVEEREGHRWGVVEEVRVIRKGSPKEPWWEPRVIVFSEDDRFDYHPFFLQPYSPSEVSAELTSEVTAELTSEVTAELTSEVTAELTSEVTAELTSEVTAESPLPQKLKVKVGDHVYCDCERGNSGKILRREAGLWIIRWESGEEMCYSDEDLSGINIKKHVKSLPLLGIPLESQAFDGVLCRSSAEELNQALALSKPGSRQDYLLNRIATISESQTFEYKGWKAQASYVYEERVWRLQLIFFRPDGAEAEPILLHEDTPAEFWFRQQIDGNPSLQVGDGHR